MPGTTEKNKIKNNVKVPAAPVLKTYKTKSATDCLLYTSPSPRDS